jgi:spermidine/putrescine-binding protein
VKIVFLYVALLASSFAYANKVINIYIAANYLADSTAQQFESECNCQLAQNYFNENDEMLAKFAAGASGYDVVVPTAYAAEQLVSMQKLQPLNLDRLPNLKNIDPQFLNQAYDPHNRYSVPYAYDNVMLAYNKKELQRLGIVADSWAVIFDPKYLKKLKGKVTVFNSQRNVFAAALLYLGKDPNSSNIDDLKQARAVIERAMPYWAKFDSDTYYRSLMRGNIWLAMSYSVDIFKTIQDLKDSHQEVTIDARLQKEGNMYELDNLVIPFYVSNTKLAYQLINNLLSTKSSIELANMTGASIMNKAALAKIDLTIKSTPWIYPANMQKMHSFKNYAPKIRIMINEAWLELQLSCHQ